MPPIVINGDTTNGPNKTSERVLSTKRRVMRTQGSQFAALDSLVRSAWQRHVSVDPAVEARWLNLITEFAAADIDQEGVFQCNMISMP